jgi:hypothetical protein
LAFAPGQYSVLQVRLAPEFIKQIRICAHTNDQYCYQVYEEAITRFVNKRRRRKRTPQYLSPPKSGKLLNVQVSKELHENIKLIIQEDNIAQISFLYTALVNFFEA